MRFGTYTRGAPRISSPPEGKLNENGATSPYHLISDLLHRYSLANETPDSFNDLIPMQSKIAGEPIFTYMHLLCTFEGPTFCSML